MKKILAVSMIAVMACATPAVMAQTAQQQKMTDCNKQATGKAGDDRKSFMKTCLSAKPAEPEKKLTPQQEKMGACNKEAAGKKGDDRKAFMKSCLSN